MPNVKANGIRIEYDTIGDPSSPPLLLIMGLGGQLINWESAASRPGLMTARFIPRVSAAR
jgi:pimeloyl-ACP methyl ester carboxylesterase